MPLVPLALKIGQLIRVSTWDLNLLRAGGLTAQSFTSAFVAIKVQEIQEQIPVPEPGMIVIFVIGLAGIAAARRKAA